jgi:hypothetical protein
MTVSDDTILRILKQRVRTAPSGADVLQIVGIDDWAWRKATSTSAPSWWTWSAVVSSMCCRPGRRTVSRDGSQRARRSR